MDSSLLTFQMTVLGLLLVACLSAIALHRLHFPYTIGLVIVGLVLGFTSESIPGVAALTSLNLSHEAILFLFLPPLIFESALTLNSRLLLRNITPVLLLATVGLLIATAIASLLMVWLTPLGWREALLFGALISATDPVAVIALFKSLGVPEQLVVLVEGESLFNDATAIVTFNLIVAAAAMETDNLPIAALTSFSSSLFGGIFVGAMLAWATSYLLIAARRSPFIQGTLSAILAFGTFIVAEHYLHISGVIAVMSAGMVTSWMVSVRLRPQSRQFLHELWEYLSFVTNSLIFLLVGLATAQVLKEVTEIKPLVEALGVAIAAIFLARAVVVFTLIPLINRIHTAPPIGLGEQAILVWGGLRGAVGLALALSLENEVDDGRFLVALTLGVALFTLLVPGTTMAALLRRLGFGKSSVIDRLETAEALLSADDKALDALRDLSLAGKQYQMEIDQVTAQIEQARSEAEAQLESIWDDMKTDSSQRQQALWRQALTIEKQAYRQMHDSGILSATAFTRVSLGISARQSEIAVGHLPPMALSARILTTQIETRVRRWAKRWLPKKSWRDRVGMEQFSTLYECDLAIAQVSHQVIKRLQALPEHCRTHRTFHDCMDYYHSGHQNAQARIVRSSQQYPAAAHRFERHIAERVAYSGREEAIATLLENGVISATVAKSVCQRFEGADA